MVLALFEALAQREMPPALARQPTAGMAPQMEISSNSSHKSSDHSVEALRGHQPNLFSGERGQILKLLLEHRGEWVSAYRLSALALQYGTRPLELRRSGYTILNRTERVGRQVHVSFSLIGCPGEIAKHLPLIVAEEHRG